MHGNHLQVPISNCIGEQGSGSGIAIEEPFSWCLKIGSSGVQRRKGLSDRMKEQRARIERD